MGTEIERKLASIQAIEEIKPIEGADAIEAYRVQGWWVVGRKNEYSVGDLVVYVSIDSWVPNELAPFLTKGREPKEYNGVKGERLRTIKLRGQISQGLLLPIAVLKWPVESFDWDDVGLDVTKTLGIQKWERPIPAALAGEIRGVFPDGIPKTDQERCQNLGHEIQSAHDLQTMFEVTEKLDGSSMTAFLSLDGEFHVCSRNLSLKPSETNSFWRVAIKNDIEAKMREKQLFGYAIQGELLGPGVQGNSYNLSDHELYVFDVYSQRDGQYMSPGERTVLIYTLGLKHVPVIGYQQTPKTVDELLKMAEGPSQLNLKAQREGLVFKETDGGFTFKAISNAWLLKNE